MSDEIDIWPGGAPGSEQWTQQETSFTDPMGAVRVRNVVKPTLTPYLPDPALANGTAVVVAPGGGFHMLSWINEGTDVAEWFQARGVAAFILKYRLVDTGPTDDDFVKAFSALAIGLATGGITDILTSDVAAMAAEDGMQAVRCVRERASQWGIATDRVGVLGFSAGAVVTTATGITDDPTARADFVAPIYGAQPKMNVPADAPPMFMVVAGDDGLCLKLCIDAFEAWKDAGRPAELHVYESGGHGFGMDKRGLPVDSWPDRLADWLTAHHFLAS